MKDLAATRPPSALPGTTMAGIDTGTGIGGGRAGRWLVVAYVVVAAALLLPVTLHTALALRLEDGLIILRYGRNLVEGHGFVFNPGERVLGVSSPLYTLVSAGIVAVAGTASPAVQNVLGVVALLVEGLMAALLAWRLAGGAERGVWAGAIAATLCLGSFNLSYLYFGMEVHLFAALVLIVCWLYLAERELACGLALGVAFLTRYDAALLALLVGGAFLVRRRRVPWRLVAAFFAVVSPWLVFAQWYFGSIVPNTLLAKEGYVGVVAYLYWVLVYVKRTFEAVAGAYGAGPVARDALAWILPGLTVAGALAAALRSRWAVLVALYPALHVLVYAGIGADPAFVWHYYLVNPMTWIFTAVGAMALVELASGRLGASRGQSVARRADGLVTAGIGALLLAPLLLHVVRDGQRRFRIDPVTEDLQTIARFIDERWGHETSLLHPAIGMLGWETDLRIIDQAGLVTPGLHYYDGLHHTPIEEVVRLHHPDLVLALDGHHLELHALGYSVIHTFDGHARYQLWGRIGARSDPGRLARRRTPS